MMNVLKDIEEKLGIPQTRRITEIGTEKLFEFIKFKDVENNSITNEYSISFSNAFDSLPMWAMYAQNGNGVSLGFNEKELVLYLKKHKCGYLKDISYQYFVNKMFNRLEINQLFNKS